MLTSSVVPPAPPLRRDTVSSLQEKPARSFYQIECPAAGEELLVSNHQNSCSL